MPDDAAIRRYLLGESSEDEADALERAYFADEDSLDRVSACEWRLIDDYLTGRLEAAVGARFEGHYLRTEPHRTRMALARALRARAVPKRTRLVHFVLPLAAAAILVLAVLGVVWAIRLPETPRGPESLVVSVAVPLVQVREEGDTPTAVLEDGTSVLELRFPAGAAAPGQPVALRTVEGTEVWRGTTEAASPAARIPAAGLPAGDYVVELEGGPRAYLRVARR